MKVFGSLFVALVCVVLSGCATFDKSLPVDHEARETGFASHSPELGD